MTTSTGKAKKISLRWVLSFTLQIVIIGFFVFYVVQNRDIFSALGNIRWQQVAWIIVLDTVSFFIGGFLNYSMIRRLEKEISFLDCLLLQYVNNLLNKILPTVGGGAAFRAIFLKKKYQLSYTQFASTIAGLYVITFCSTSLIGITCIFLLYSRSQIFNWIIFLAFSGILLSTLVIIFFSPRIPHFEGRLFKFIHGVAEGWNILKQDPTAILIYTILSILFLLLSALRAYITYEALGVQTDLTAMVFLSSLGIIIAFLNFTPDGIGVKEGIYLFTQGLVQIPGAMLVLGSLTQRAISILTTFTFGGISYWLLLRQMRGIDHDPRPIPPPAA